MNERGVVVAAFAVKRDGSTDEFFAQWSQKLLDENEERACLSAILLRSKRRWYTCHVP
jgi:hypothetical protein